MERVALPERPNWREKAAEAGFGFHEMYGEPYWLDDAAYVFSLDEIERDIETPAETLHAMCLDIMPDIVASEEMLTKLAIPAEHHDCVRDSWNDGDRHIYGRFDFAYTGDGHSGDGGVAKLLEYNADTPTSIFEGAWFQHNWMIDQIEAGVLPEDVDQFNLLQESLIDAFATFAPDRIFHFACWMSNEEDRGTTTYLMDCAVQAGHQTEMIDIQDIGVDDEGRFTDMSDRTIDRCFKLYPWEDMFTEPFAEHLRPGVFVEPAWKAVLSNKAILPLLWDRHPGHPNLLPSYFSDDPRVADLGEYVTKPYFSREGQNVDLIQGGKTTEAAQGAYGGSPRVAQAYSPLFETEGRHAVLGVWMVGDRAAGLGMREDSSRITKDMSRFVPHIIQD
ncbi:glutathionylspermidine synthase family protein [Erythrobacter sp. Alg231-14]|uniref:glutathionylspermidine synthase family protein n=1 Tax=Erythrobacter sp. Alg231-14 TaxID=1922225 RepID=UPI000D56269D